MEQILVSPKPRWFTLERSEVEGYTRWTLFCFASQMPYSWKHKYRLIVSTTF